MSMKMTVILQIFDKTVDFCFNLIFFKIYKVRNTYVYLYV